MEKNTSKGKDAACCRCGRAAITFGIEQTSAGSDSVRPIREFSWNLALEHDLPLPLGFYSVFASRTELFEARANDKVQFTEQASRACMKPSEIASYVQNKLRQKT